ncbi:helicase associated domain-containing protein [Embleya sp. NPDC008237]|uniref:helicase associated domain-containing protein n=1 Tax=Embleya sp. NPDC008237 TaxID=3363978 RepID=UPI0036EFC452
MVGDARPDRPAGAAGVGEGDGAIGVRARRGKGAWRTAFAAAVRYRGREGHLEVPRAHVETVAAVGSGEVVLVRLGKWVNNQRTRRGSLGEERERLLTELGMRW